MSGDKQLHRGDHVEWSTHGTTTEGGIVEKITGDTEVAGRTVSASDDHPQYQVRSGKGGRDAAQARCAGQDLTAP